MTTQPISPGLPRSRNILAARLALLSCVTLTACGGGGGGASMAVALPPPAAVTPMNCADLAGMAIPASAIGLASTGAVVTSATLIAPSGAGAKALPEYCSVLASINPVDPTAPAIKMQVALPTAWNKKAMMFGGEGYDGSIPNVAGDTFIPATDQPTPLARGYAVFASDSGHTGTASQANFALNAEAYANWAHDALKKTRDTAIYLINKRYAASPGKSYFAGGSTGGREGFWWAQNYPKDFQGLIIHFPGYLMSTFSLQLGRATRALAQPDAYLDKPKRAALLKAALQACDALDGVADGLVGNVNACNASFDPATATLDGQPLRCPAGADTGDSCLSDPQIAAVKTMASPLSINYPLASAETQYPGWNIWGSDLGQGGAPGSLGFFVNYVGLYDAAPANPMPANAATVGQLWDTYAKYLVTQDANFDSLSLDPENPGPYAARISQLSQRMDVNSVDLGAFRAAGGKMLIEHGMADVLVSPRSTEQYWNRLKRDMGADAVASFARFYEIPGFGHAFSTMFAPAWDSVTALETWVEKGAAPVSPTITDTFGVPGRTRPLCEYPSFPRYKGSGDVNTAANFSCATQ